MLFITRHYCGLILECPLPKASSCARDRICGSQMDYGDTTTDLLVGGRARLKENHWWHYLEVYIFHSGSFLLSLLPSCHDVSSFPLSSSSMLPVMANLSQLSLITSSWLQHVCHRFATSVLCWPWTITVNQNKSLPSSCRCEVLCVSHERHG